MSSHDTNQRWIKSHHYEPRYIEQVSRHLHGRSLDDAIDHMHSIHMTPWGTTAQSHRAELVRTLKHLDDIADVLVTTWDDI